MKIVSLLSVLILSTPAFAKTVSVNCVCTYMAEYLIQPGIYVSGRDRQATEESIKGCEIVDPQGQPVASGKWGKAKDVYKCGFAVLNARNNCQEEVSMRFSMDSMKQPSVHIEPNACWASIEE